jgi:hypothetical protein
MPAQQLGIDFHPSLKILGIIFAAKTEMSGTHSWATIVHAVRAQAKRTYSRKLCLAQRVQYVNTFLLAKLWYTAQVLPTRPRFVQQLATVCSWFIWQGTVFRVPASTLHQSKTKDGWGLLHIAAKCRTLLLYRGWILSRKASMITTAWIQRWRLMDAEENPPHRNRIPGKLHYFRICD